MLCMSELNDDKRNGKSFEYTIEHFFYNLISQCTSYISQKASKEIAVLLLACLYFNGKAILTTIVLLE